MRVFRLILCLLWLLSGYSASAFVRIGGYDDDAEEKKYTEEFNSMGTAVGEENAAKAKEEAAKKAAAPTNPWAPAPAMGAAAPAQNDKPQAMNRLTCRKNMRQAWLKGELPDASVCNEPPVEHALRGMYQVPQVAAKPAAPPSPPSPPAASPAAAASAVTIAASNPSAQVVANEPPERSPDPAPLPTGDAASNTSSDPVAITAQSAPKMIIDYDPEDILL